MTGSAPISGSWHDVCHCPPAPPFPPAANALSAAPWPANALSPGYARLGLLLTGRTRLPADEAWYFSAQEDG